MRKVLLVLGLAAALAVPAAGVRPAGTAGRLRSAMRQQRRLDGLHTDDRRRIPAVRGSLAHIRHFLIVNYCKHYGIITSVSIAAHGCDTSGLVSCHIGPAWQTGGGVGFTSATFEGHVTWTVTTTAVRHEQRHPHPHGAVRARCGGGGSS